MMVFSSIVRLVEFLKYYYGRMYIKTLTSKFSIYEIADICYPIYVKNPSNIEMGKGVKIGPYCTIGAFKNVKIGENARISSHCTIETGSLNLNKLDYGEHQGRDIVIGKNVWIGTGSIILSGAHIGDNSFIYAGSVVSKVIPANSIFKNGIVKKRIYE